MAETETIYLERDNSIDLRLRRDGVILTDEEMNFITKVALRVQNLVIESTNADDAPIRWQKEGYRAGEIRLFLGRVAGLYPTTATIQARLIVYDGDNPEGVEWGSIPINIKIDARSI